MTFKDNLLLELDKNKYNIGKGIIIETGAGMPLYNLLTCLPNTASKLVKYANSPTDFTYTKEHYNILNSYRAISSDITNHICKKELILNSEVSFVFCNSIQIGNDINTQTHGWISYYANKVIYDYHFVINNLYQEYNRIELLDIISTICLEIFLSGNIKPITNGYIDIILNNNETHLIKNTLDNLLNAYLLKENVDDTYLVYDNDKFIRFNDFCRNNENLIIFKGSFDPLHDRHLEIINYMSNLGYKVVLMISINNYDINKKINIINLISRLQIISSLGLSCIINTKGLYKDNILFLSNHRDFKNKSINFLLGDDILNNIIKQNKIDNYDYSNVNFYVANRINIIKIIEDKYNINYLDELGINNISSTSIRLGQYDIQNKELVEIIKKYYKIC